jgi:putative membrane protein
MEQTLFLCFCSLDKNVIAKSCAMKSLRILILSALLPSLICSCSRSLSPSKDQTKKRSKITGVTPTVQNPNRSVINASGDGLTPGIGQQRSAGSEENAANIALNAIARANASIKNNQKQLESLTEEELIDKLSAALQMEIKLSTAQLTSADSKIKYYATTVLNDHKQAQKELVKLSTQRNLPFVTPGLAKAAKKADLEFVQMMIESNQNMIGLYNVAGKSKDSDIRAFALKQLPILKNHLETAQELTKIFKPGLKKAY